MNLASALPKTLLRALFGVLVALAAISPAVAEVGCFADGIQMVADTQIDASSGQEDSDPGSNAADCVSGHCGFSHCGKNFVSPSAAIRPAVASASSPSYSIEPQRGRRSARQNGPERPPQF